MDLLIYLIIAFVAGMILMFFIMRNMNTKKRQELLGINPAKMDAGEYYKKVKEIFGDKGNQYG